VKTFLIEKFVIGEGRLEKDMGEERLEEVEAYRKAKLRLRIRYQEFLADLTNAVVEMFEIVISAVRDSIESLKNQNVELAKRVIESISNIQEMELKIEEKCLDLLLLQQPMGEDIRFIATSMKIITDLAQIGTISGNIAETIIKTMNKPFYLFQEISQMSEILQEMLRTTLKAFFTKRADYLQLFEEENLTIRDIFEQFPKKIISFATETPNAISDIAPLMLVERYLERITYHCSNIKTRIIYMISGVREKINYSLGS
jgi:phosphate transport system protein